jgi:hypothetical protein
MLKMKKVLHGTELLQRYLQNRAQPAVKAAEAAYSHRDQCRSTC